MANHKKKSEKQDNLDLEKLVNGADINLVRQLLLSVLEQDEDIRNIFLAFVAPKPADLDVSGDIDKLNNIVTSYADEDDFIDYDKADDFSQDIIDFIFKDVAKLLHGGKTWEAFEITQEIYRLINELDVDDSNGGLYGIYHYLLEIWYDMISEATKKERLNILEWFLKQSIKEEDIFNEELMSDMVDPFIGMDSKYDEKVLKFINKILPKLEKDAKKFNSNYALENWVHRKLNLLSRGSNEFELGQMKKKYWKLLNVRIFFTENAIHKKDYLKAISIIEEGLVIDKHYPGVIASHHEQLKELYKLTKDKKNYEKELWIVLELSADDPETTVENYYEIKKFYGKAWVQKKPLVYEKLQNSYALGPIFRAEKDYAHLLDFVKNANNLNILLHFLKDLQDKYPKEMCELLDELIKEETKKANGRSDYKKIAQYLKILQQVPGGKSQAQRTTLDLFSTYPRKIALKDELKGFLFS